MLKIHLHVADGQLPLVRPLEKVDAAEDGTQNYHHVALLQRQVNTLKNLV